MAAPSLGRSLVLRMVGWHVLIIFGGLSLLRVAPGPAMATIAVTVAYLAAVGTAMYFVEVRVVSRG